MSVVSHGTDPHKPGDLVSLYDGFQLVKHIPIAEKFDNDIHTQTLLFLMCTVILAKALKQISCFN